MSSSKPQTLNPKQIQNTKEENKKPFDLEARTAKYAKNVYVFLQKIPKTLFNIQYLKQLIRSSSSVGANYIEASEALSRKDFYLRMKICRKEAKESVYWLRLIEGSSEHDKEKSLLIGESIELCKIFGSIVSKNK